MADEARRVLCGQHLLKDHLSKLSAYEKKSATISCKKALRNSKLES